MRTTKGRTVMATTSRAHARKRLAATDARWAALQDRAISAWQAFVPWWEAQAAVKV